LSVPGVVCDKLDIYILIHIYNNDIKHSKNILIKYYFAHEQDI